MFLHDVKQVNIYAQVNKLPKTFVTSHVTHFSEQLKAVRT